MTLRSSESAGRKNVTHWDDRDSLSRFYTIMTNRDLFWSLGLVTESELALAESMSESAIEYVLDREDQPIFTSIDIKKDIEAQNHREKLEAALRAVIF